MTLIVILNAVLAALIVGVIVTLHTHAIVTEHRLRPRRPTLRALADASAPQAADHWSERRAA